MANKQGQPWLQREIRGTGRSIEVRIMPEDYVDEAFLLGVKALKARHEAQKGLATLAELEAELARLKARK